MFERCDGTPGIPILQPEKLLNAGRLSGSNWQVQPGSALARLRIRRKVHKGRSKYAKRIGLAGQVQAGRKDAGFYRKRMKSPPEDGGDDGR